uniref:CUB domain-containing protein n=1 Tax=Acrobeloides nanus TaxID=290746 RepID=A0A914CZE8_9BILA
MDMLYGTNTIDPGSSDASYYSTDAELYVYFTAGTQQELNDFFWYINFSLIHVPQITIKLTNNLPVSLLTLSDFQPNTIYNILVENGTLDFFPAFNSLNRFFPYVDVFQGTTGLNWDNYLGSLSTIIAQSGSPFDGLNSTQLKPMSLGYPLTIFRKSNDTVNFENWMLFRIREIHTMNCPDFNNVFKISFPYGMAIDYSARSTGNCILTFFCFAGNFYGPLDLCKLSFSDIKYTGDKNLTGTRGLSEGAKIFSFDSTSSSLWNGVSVYSNPFSFIIPPNGTIHTSASASSKINSQYYSAPSNGILMSPQYPYKIDSKLMKNSTLINMKIFHNTQFEFDFVDIDLSFNSSLMIYNSTYLLLNLNGTQNYGGKLQINSTNVTLVYTPASNATEKGFLINYSLRGISIHTTPSSSSLIKPINILTLLIVGMIIMFK